MLLISTYNVHVLASVQGRGAGALPKNAPHFWASLVEITGNTASHDV